jgi:hypothetical protein
MGGVVGRWRPRAGPFAEPSAGLWMLVLLDTFLRMNNHPRNTIGPAPAAELEPDRERDIPTFSSNPACPDITAGPHRRPRGRRPGTAETHRD